MKHSHLIKDVNTLTSQRIDQLAQNDPEIEELWNYVRIRPAIGFIPLLGSSESDSESVKLLLQSLKHTFEDALADFKAHPHGNRERNVFKAREIILTSKRVDCID